MLVNIDNTTLIDAYYQAIQINLEPEFILALEYELLQRGLLKQMKQIV